MVYLGMTEVLVELNPKSALASGIKFLTSEVCGKAFVGKSRRSPSQSICHKSFNSARVEGVC